MTDKQFEKLMEQLFTMNESLKQIANTLEDLNEDTSDLCNGLVADPEDNDCIISVPSMLMQILDDM